MTKWDSTWQMESDTSAEIIMQNTGIQQAKDACKELMLKKKKGRSDSRQQIWYELAKMIEESTAPLIPPLDSFVPACIVL